LDLISTKKISMQNLITHTFGLEKLEEALKLSMDGEALKVCIKPQV
jgi:threonine dehydrogenase-like Zn-dependent dehydrogenase